jgi:hypothetical protein
MILTLETAGLESSHGTKCQTGATYLPG